MAISLESLFNLRTTTRVTEDAGASQASGNQNTAGAAGKANAVLPNMTPGQTVQGTIVSLDGEEIQLLLGEGQTIRAQVDESMNLQVGQKLLFTVMGNSSSQVRLSPLFFNMEQGLNAQKALEDAGLPATKENMTMVDAMMKEGMPIDKESLLHMSRTLAAYPEEPVMNLVQMTRIGMPLTPENLEQFAHYKNLEHKLVEGMNTVMDDLSATYTEIADTFGADRAGEFYQTLLDTFLPEEGNGLPGMVPTEKGAENGALSGETVNEDGTVVLPETVGEKPGKTPWCRHWMACQMEQKPPRKPSSPKVPSFRKYFPEKNGINSSSCWEKWEKTMALPRYRTRYNLSGRWHRREPFLPGSSMNCIPVLLFPSC